MANTPSNESAPLVILDLVSLSTTLPQKQPRELERDSLLNGIEDYITAGVGLIFIDGPEGNGKTTMLAQFARKHPHNCISFFINPFNATSYNIENILCELAIQGTWILTGDELKDIGAVTENYVSRIFAQLARKAARNGRKYGIILDGLDDIPSAAEGVIKYVLSLLPLNDHRFYIILSRNTETHVTLAAKIPYKEYQVTGFSKAETRDYFKADKTSDELIEEIYLTTRGSPQYLASISRQVDAGQTLDAVVKSMPANMAGALSMEWRQVDTNDRGLLLCLAMMAFDKIGITIQAIAEYTELNVGTLKTKLSSLAFVRFDSDERPSFVSTTIRRFAEQRLAAYKKEVDDLIIAHLLKKPDDARALDQLPGYLQQAGRGQEVLQYLSTDRIVRLVQITQSVAAVRSKTAQGINIAQALGKDADLFRFSLQHSTLANLSKSDALRNEIEALLAVGEHEEALSLADSCPLREDRFKLLLLVAKNYREEKREPPRQLIDQLHALFSQVDLSALKDAAEDIAAEIAHFDVQWALEVIHRFYPNAEGSRSVDLALAELSIATMSQGSKGVSASNATVAFSEQINDPSVKNIAKTLQMVFAGTGDAELRDQIQKISDPSDQIFLLRQWLLANRDAENAASVVNFALDLIIKTTDYSPNAKVVREIATPLAFSKDTELVERLVTRIDAQKSNFQDRGPTEELVRLEGILIRAECLYSSSKALLRLNGVLDYASGQTDPAIASACLTRVIFTIERLPAELAEQKRQVLSIATERLATAIETTLLSAADHYVSVQNSLPALTLVKLEAAVSIAKQLNTQWSRDRALASILDALSEAPSAQITSDAFVSVYSNIISGPRRTVSLAAFVRALGNHPQKKQLEPTLLRKLADLSREMIMPDLRCNAIEGLYSLICDQSPSTNEDVLTKLITESQNSRQQIDSLWSKIDYSFRSARCFAKTQKAHSLGLIKEARERLADTEIESEDLADTYCLILRLAIRAAGALASLENRASFSDEDLTRVTLAIGQIPSVQMKASLFAELYVRLHFANHATARRVAIDHLLPALRNTTELASYDRCTVIVDVAPALYLFHAPTCDTWVNGILKEAQSEAWANIIECLLYRCPPDEPYYAAPRHAYKITHQCILDILSIADRLQTDKSVYLTIDCVCNSMCKRKDFTREQVADIAQRLTALVKAKLPDPKNITHEGYRIISEVRIASIRTVSGEVWSRWLADAHKIPNFADRWYVIADIAGNLPGKNQERLALFEEAKENIRKIPVIVDRIERFESLARAAWDWNPTLGAECMRLAMLDTKDWQNPDSADVQRRLIDTAYQFSEEFASSLASILDPDPAKKKSRAKKPASEQYEIQKLKNDMARTSPEKIEPERLKHLGESCRKMLGEVNAGVSAGIPIGSIRDYVIHASRLPFIESEPIMALLIETLSTKYHATQEALKVLRPIFESVAGSAELFAHFSRKMDSDFRRATITNLGESIDGGMIVREAAKEGAVSYILEWVRSSCEDYLIISDPYFKCDDLEFIKEIMFTKPGLTITVLTSFSAQSQQSTAGEPSLASRYQSAWRSISMVNDPDINIVVHGVGSRGDSVFHDRWWITRAGGLRTGTSIGSLGGKKISEVVLLSQAEAQVREQELTQYLTRRAKTHAGEKITYANLILR